ncbi:DUF551 domain-containing protein [Cronobacter sakazakii]
MSTISNERLEELASGDMEVWYSESQAMARELLALRKEREKAEPVAWVPKSQLDLLKKFRMVEADMSSMQRFDETPLYTAPPAPTDKPKSEMSQKAEQLVRDTTALAEKLSAEADTTSQQFESLAGKAVGGWIPCSERMPPENTGVLVATEFDGPGDWRMKWGTRVPGHPDAKNGWLIPGASWTPSHWQPIPEPPCK